MKYFSWKWVAFGLGYSLITMSILKMGLPVEDEIIHDFYGILMAGRENFSVITALGVIVFGAYPWLRRRDRVIGRVLVMLLVMILASASLVALGSLVVLAYAQLLLLVLGAASLMGFVSVILYALVMLAVWICIYALPMTGKIIKGGVRTVRIALAKDN